MRRIAVPLLLMALLVAATGVALRGCEIRSDPNAGLIDPFKGITVPPKPPRVRAAERPATPPPRSVRVAVTSMDGTPIPGARVELVPGPEDEYQRGFIPSAAAPPRGRTVAAGEDGSATVENVASGRWFVVAEAPGHARHALAGVVREGDEPAATTVALEKGHTFAGTVRDPDGAPAADVTVILVPRVKYRSDATCLRTTTSKDGSYRFEGVDGGQHRLWYVPHAGLCVEEASVLVPQLDGLDIRMARGATVEGTVHDADTGGAVLGARVLAFRYSDSPISSVDGSTVLLDAGVTDELGRFSMRTWRRRTDVTYLLVDADGYAASPVDGGGRIDARNAEEGQRFFADLRVRRAGAVKGTVSIEGRPVAGVRLRVRPGDDYAMEPPGGRAWFAVTASDGVYRCDRLPAGAATISVWGAGSYPPLADDVPVEIECGRETERNVAVEAHRVRVTRRVADESEDPKALAGVDVVQRIGHLSAAARTDADGRFTMDAWFLGDHAPVDLRRGAFVQGSYISADDEDGADIHPSFPAAESAYGTVLGPDGAPSPGVRVELWAGMQFPHEFGVVWRSVREAVSGPDGTFRLPVVSGPEFIVRAVGTPWPDEERGDDGSIRLQLPEVFRFNGRVVASETGEPIARALVFDASGDVMTRTDADGRFAVEGRAGLISKVRVAGEGRLDAAAEPEPDEWVVALRPAFSVAGVVHLVDGSPVSGALVRVTGSDAGPSSTTDREGRFVLSALDAGRCEIEVSDTTRCTIANSRVSAQAGTRDLTIAVSPGSRIVVRVTDAAGRRVAWAEVTAHAESSDVADVVGRTRSDGEVAFGLAPDVAYTIRVACDRYEPAEVKDVRSGGEPLRVVLTRKSPR